MLRSRTHDERGAAAVESAALFWDYQAAASAAREAARFGAVQPCDNATIEARGDQRVAEAAPVPGSTGFTDVTSGAIVQVGDQLTVEVSFATNRCVPLPGTWPTIVRSATTRVENIPAGGC